MSKITFEQSEIAKKLANYKMPRYDEMTPFPVVMRQLVSILDGYLSIFRAPGEEKLLTQSMINSYVHNKVVKAPENKEYTKNHIVHLICIGILKQVLSMDDISKILKLQTDQYSLEVAYNYFCDEIEQALSVTFGSRSFAELKHKPKVITPLSESARSAVIAFANKIYVKHSINFELNN